MSKTRLRQLTLFDMRNVSPEKQQQAPKKRNTRAKKKQQSESEENGDSSSSDLDRIQLSQAPRQDADDGEDTSLASPLKYPKKTKVVVISSTSGSESSLEESAQPKKRRRLKRRASSTPSDGSEDETKLAEEVDTKRILPSRLRTRGTRSTRQKMLDKLKTRRRGGQTEGEEDSGEQESTSGDEEMTPFRGAKPSGEADGSEGSGSDDSESSFIVQDDNDAVHLPAQFSMETHQNLSHQFKKIFQFFCHIAVQPPKKRRQFMETQMKDTEYFSVPLTVTRRKLDGLRDSLVQSSVWRPNFKKSLDSYPHLEIVQLDFAVPACDACHLGGRLSTRLGRVSGSKYDRVGFEHIRARKRDQEDQKEFHLGRFCANRTRVYHRFMHWEYELFYIILDEVKRLRQSTEDGFEQLFTSTKPPPSDHSDADAICEWLDSRHIIDGEWRKLKDMMESARHLEMKMKSGDITD